MFQLSNTLAYPEGVGETRWLSPAEQRAWRAYLQASALLEDQLDRQLQRDAGIPHLYYALLVHLSEAADRRLRMTELAERLKITRSRLSHAVSRLEERGWVGRVGCSSDGRVQYAALTDAGLAVLREIAPGHAAAVRSAVFDRLTPEQVQALTEIGETIAAGLSSDLPWLR